MTLLFACSLCWTTPAAWAQPTDYDALAAQTRQQSLQRLEELLRHTDPTAPRRPEMMLRLAELYRAEGRTQWLAEEERLLATQRACERTEGCDPTSLQADHSVSASWFARSVRLYEGILARYPRYDRVDQATFFLGSALAEAGSREDAFAAFKRLVVAYPDSPFAPDAYLQIGEYYFDVAANPHGARRAYERASRFDDYDKRLYALYRLAWCHYNLDELQRGIDALLVVVRASLEPDAEPGALQLGDEALADLVRFYADAEAYDDAVRTLEGLGRPDLVREVQSRLADRLSETGAFERAIEMYQRLLLDAPMAPDAPEHAAAIVRAASKQADRTTVLQQLERSRTTYGPGSAWAQQQEPQVRADAHDALERQLRTVATRLHTHGRTLARARRTADADATYADAAQVYALYLDAFGERTAATDVRYAFGELLYAVEDYAGAHTQYTRVAHDDPHGPHGRFCAEGAVHAAEALVRAEGGPLAGAAVQLPANPTPRPLSRWQQAYVDACRHYADTYDDHRVDDMLYRSAYLLYNTFRFDEAAAQFEAVIRRDPTSQEAEYSAQLILDALAVNERWLALRDTSLAFHTQPRLGSAAFKQDMLALHQRASLEIVAARFEADADHATAGDGFRAFHDAFPDAPQAAVALHNAAFHYHSAGRLPEAVAARRILVDDERFGPRTPYYAEQLGHLAVDLERTADFAGAALLHERLAEVEPTEERGRDARFSAAVLREALGDLDTAVAHLQRYARDHEGDARAAQVHGRLGRILTTLGRHREAAAAYAAAAQASAGEARLQAVRSQGAALAAAGDRGAQRTLYATAVGEAAEGSDAVGRMKLVLMEPALQAYRAVELRGVDPTAPPAAQDRVLAEALRRKMGALQELEAQIAEVVSLGTAGAGFAGLLALGGAYEELATALRTAEVPAYLDDDQRVFYTDQLAERAYAQEEKAVRTYAEIRKRAFELQWYDTSVLSATRRLGVLRPEVHDPPADRLDGGPWLSTPGHSRRPAQPETTL
ncbi:MAG: tetratricopeptide repeat protein [Myxococcales bacterium]|nr:tetratricopeptide repeat protein [Myxococcales bacterium]